MIIEYIRYKIAEEKQKAFITAYEKAYEYLEASPYCLGYELSHCEEDQENFILRIKWTSTEEHLNGFRKSTNFGLFLNHVRPFFNDILEMNHYEVLAK